MGRKRKEGPLSRELPPLIHRINWLLVHKWANSITYMAIALGVSHAALSRVLAGQAPSGKMLEALTRQPDVNITWLFTGDGQPLVERGQSIGAFLCPVARDLLVGPPRDYPDELSLYTLPVASPYFIEAAYWYCTGSDDPIVKAGTQSVAAGDYLLIETSKRWTGRLKAYAGRIVVLQVPDQRTAILGAVTRSEEIESYFEDELHHGIDTFGVFPKAWLIPGLTRQATGGKLRNVPKGVAVLFSDDVVGICLQLGRILHARETDLT